MIYQAALQFVDLLAASTKFQELVQANGATEAKNFIHFYRTDEQSEINQQQFAVIDNQPNFSIQRRSPSTGPCAFTRQTGLRFVIVSEYNFFNATNTKDFIIKLGEIIEDLMNISGTESLYKIESMTQVEPINIEKDVVADPLRWQDGARRGYHAHFTVTRSNN